MEWMTPVRVVTATLPLVEAQDDGSFVVEFEDAGTSVRLSVEQLDALISRALAAKMLDPDEEDRREREQLGA